MTSTPDKLSQTASSSFNLVHTDVHVWRFYLDSTPQHIQKLKQHLSADEMDRADRFYFTEHRHRFIARHALLRRILGHYLAIEPVEINFTTGLYGKPALVPAHRSSICFNMSSSNNIGLVAIAHGREVGVDLEHIKPGVAEEAIPEQFFSQVETTKLRSLPRARQADAFYSCWSRKEAFIKALGTGLSRDLDSFDVSLAPGEPAALLETRPERNEVQRWGMETLDIDPAFAAALVVEGKRFNLRVGDWLDLS
jgi:4'-phosphopantetheinyl transferase